MLFRKYTDECFFLLFQLPKNSEEWLIVANGFKNAWQFPHCLGALDGKHIKLQAPINSGSEYFNYKNSFSIILLGLADSDCNFLFADIGTHGRMSDGGVFYDSLIYTKIQENEIFPEASSLPGRDVPVPYVFVADAAWLIRENNEALSWSTSKWKSTENIQSAPITC